MHSDIRVTHGTSEKWVGFFQPQYKTPLLGLLTNRFNFLFLTLWRHTCRAINVYFHFIFEYFCSWLMKWHFFERIENYLLKIKDYFLLRWPQLPTDQCSFFLLSSHFAVLFVMAKNPNDNTIRPHLFFKPFCLVSVLLVFISNRNKKISGF